MSIVGCQAAGALLKEKQNEDGQQTYTELARKWKELESEYMAVWLQRNRSGGLSDSVKRFGVMQKFFHTKLSTLEW